MMNGKNMKQILFALAILLAAVSCSEELIETPAEQETETTFELAVKADKGESPVTKALSIETNAQGKHVLNASWETSDIISAVRSEQVIGTLSPKTSGSSAILAGTVTGELRKGHTIYLYWPRDGNSYDYTGQDGKLETIASRYDYIYGSTEITSIENGSITCKPVTFHNSQAIVKFILKDGSGDPVYPDRLVLSASDGSGNSMLFTANGNRGQLAIDVDQSAGSTNEVYAAIRQWSDASVFQVSAYVPGYVYRKQKTTTTSFEPGKYYEITVNLGTKEVDQVYTVDSFSFDFDFGESARNWPVFVFFDDITTGYWYDPDGSGSTPGSFVNLGGTVAADLAGVKKVTAVSMPHWTNQTPVYGNGKWTFGNIEGWEYIAHGKVACEYSLVEGNPHLSADITLAAPAETGKEIRVYNNATNSRVAYNNLIPMGLAYVSSDGLISEVSADPGGWISLVRSSDPESTTTYGYAKAVASPTSFGYLALERNNNGTKTYYHQFFTNIEEPGHHPLVDYNTYSVIQDNNGLDWIQVGKDHYVTINGINWWTTNLAADRYNPEPHPWTAAVLSWAPATDNQFAADRKARSLSEATFYGNSELPSINSDAPNYRTFFSATSAYHLKLRVCGTDGVIMADNTDPTKFLFMAVPDRENYQFVYYYNSTPDYIVYSANDYYWAKEYDPDQTRQQANYFDDSHGIEYWNFYRTSALNINFQEPGGSYVPPYRFPYTGTGTDGYGLPDFGCSAEPIEGSLQPIRVYLPVRPIKK